MSNITIEQNNDKFRGVWLPNTFYRQDDMVFDGTSLWVALADFTSGATFDVVNWFCPECDGGGQLHHRTVWDMSTATLNGYTSYNRKKFTTTVNGNFNTIRANTVYNTSSSQPVYFELVMDYSDIGNSNQIGLGWGNQLANLFEGKFIFRKTGKVVLAYPSVNENWDLSWSYMQGDILRFFIKGTNVWFGYKSGAFEYVMGDPLTQSSPTTNNLPPNTDIFISGMLYSNSESMILHTTNDEFESDPLGFDAWDDYV